MHASRNGTLSFGIGRAGSGVPFHFHGPVLAETAHGRKRWLLARDKPQFDPNESSVSYVRNLKGNLPSGMLDCDLYPGGRLKTINQSSMCSFIYNINI